MPPATIAITSTRTSAIDNSDCACDTGMAGAGEIVDEGGVLGGWDDIGEYYAKYRWYLNRDYPLGVPAGLFGR
jgi:hypothetical protein